MLLMPCPLSRVPRCRCCRRTDQNISGPERCRKRVINVETLTIVEFDEREGAADEKQQCDQPLTLGRLGVDAASFDVRG